MLFVCFGSIALRGNLDSDDEDDDDEIELSDSLLPDSSPTQNPCNSPLETSTPLEHFPKSKTQSSDLDTSRLQDDMILDHSSEAESVQFKPGNMFGMMDFNHVMCVYY